MCSFSTKVSVCVACLQIHPMGLCNDGDFVDPHSDQVDYGWVVVVKLELPQLDPDPCMSIYDKVSNITDDFFICLQLQVIFSRQFLVNFFVVFWSLDENGAKEVKMHPAELYVSS